MAFLELFGGQITQDRFAKRFRAQLLKKRPELSVVYEADEFRFVVGESQTVINLHNIYFKYKNAALRERPRVLAEFVAGVFELPEIPTNFADVRTALFPAIRHRSLIDYLQLEARLQQEEPLVLAQVALSEDAALMLVIDSERAITMVTEQRLTEWGVTFDHALGVAMSNLRDVSADRFQPLASGIVRGDWNDSFDSSRLLLSDLIHRGVTHGSPVVMVPAREAILLAPSRDPDTLVALIQSARAELEHSGRKCSVMMYQFVDGKPQQFHPTDPVATDALRQFQLESLFSDYADQKEHLERVHVSENLDIFVASYLLQEFDGKLASICSWTEGVISLLPKTEHVALVSGPTEAPIVRAVEWDVLVAECPDMLQPAADYPPRFRVDTFPAELFESLGASGADTNRAMTSG